MANNCNATILFSGLQENIDQLKQHIVTKDKKNYDTINYNDILPYLPKINDKELFKLVGLDYDDYITSNLSQLPPLIVQLLSKNKFIGLRSDYINTVWNTEVIEQPNSLTLSLEMPWYCPNKFFTYMADKFHTNVVIIEKTQGNSTAIVYKNHNNYVYMTVNLDNAQNKDFIKVCLQHNLIKPAEFLLSAIYHVDFSLAQSLMEQYHITERDLDNAIHSMQHNDEVLLYQSSVFSQNIAKSNDYSPILTSLKSQALSLIKKSHKNQTRFNF